MQFTISEISERKKKLLRVSAVTSVWGVAFEGHKVGTVITFGS